MVSPLHYVERNEASLTEHQAEFHTKLNLSYSTSSYWKMSRALRMLCVSEKQKKIRTRNCSSFNISANKHSSENTLINSLKHETEVSDSITI